MCYLQYRAQANGLDDPIRVQAACGSDPSEDETKSTGRQSIAQAQQHLNRAKRECQGTSDKGTHMRPQH